MPKKIFVTRHRGAVTWAAEESVKARKVEMENFEPSTVMPGDIVLGTLPVHIAAQVNARGGHYWHLTMDVPIEFRGSELSADQMRAFGARLEEFRVQGLGLRVSSQAEHVVTALTPAKIHLCIATGQTLPNFLPLVALPWEKVVIFASRGMAEQTKRLVWLVNFLSAAHGMQGSRCEIVSMPDRLDWESLRTFAVEQASRFIDEGPIDFNITGGSKLMTLAFNDAFRSLARQIYCSTQDESIDIIDTVHQSSVVLPPDLLDVDLYLAAQGFQRAGKGGSPEFEIIKDRESLTISLALCAQELTAAFFCGNVELGVSPNSYSRINYKTTSLLSLLHAIGAEAKSARQRNKVFEPLVRINYAKNTILYKDVLKAFQSHGLIIDLRFEPAVRPDDMDISFKFSNEDAAIYMGGGYLEEYVLLCLESLGLPKTHFAGGVGIGVIEKNSPKVSDELNELDAVAVWRNRLLVIECKAGVQLTTGKDQDILNKLDQLKDNVGGAMGKAWLVSSRIVNTPDVMQRAKLHGIEIAHGKSDMIKLSASFANELKCNVNPHWKPQELLLPCLKKATTDKAR